MSFGIPVRNGVMLGLTASTALTTRGGFPVPALSLNFLSGTLDSRITFTRALDTATRVNSSGFIENVNANIPRFDYDPVTLQPRGLLIEEARSNLLLQSQTFETASWAKTLSTVSSNAANGPDNALTADKFIPNNGATLSGAITSQDISKAASAITYTYSVFGKSDGFDRILLRCQDSGGSVNRANVTVNVSTGAIVTAAAVAGTFTNASAKVTIYGNGYFRIELTFTSSADTFLRSQIYALDSVATTGDGIKGVLLYGAQLEAGTFATSYISTIASAVTRNADNATMTGTNFSNWYNQSQGTFIFGASFSGSLVINASPFAISGDLNNYSNWIAIVRNATTNVCSYNIITGGAAQSGFTNGAAIPNVTPAKAAIAYRVNDIAGSTNGATPGTDTSATIPTLTRLLLGREQDGSVFLNGHIRSIVYFNTRLPNDRLQALTR